MKHFLHLTGVVLLVILSAPLYAGEFSCGGGYVLSSHAKIDGINAAECVKLWCRDLETGKSMGTGNKPSSGYKDTAAATDLCDARGNCVMCWGERKWCTGEPVGIWNAEYGAYTRNGADNATYRSYQKGSCFAWRLEKPDCPEGQTAILQNDEWICAVANNAPASMRASGVRRTGVTRRITR